LTNDGEPKVALHWLLQLAASFALTDYNITGIAPLSGDNFGTEYAPSKAGEDMLPLQVAS
jgi:hypothetical protein